MPARVAVFVFAAALLVAGCVSSKSSAPSTTGRTATSKATASGKTTTNSAPSALQAEANSMKYPEGWAQQGKGARVTFRDKNNIVRVVVTPGATPTAASIRADVRRLRGAHVQSGPQLLTISGARAFKVVYTTASPRNAVTGKRVTLLVDRYYLSRAGKEAIVDLGTPVGVDNVDAYRLMIESFRWR